MIVLTRLMPLLWARAPGKAVGAGRYYFNSRMRRLAIRNLELAYPEWTTDMRRVVARQNVQSTGELMLEMGRVWTQPWAQTAALLEVDGLGCVKEPLASGQGVINLCLHLGNCEPLGIYLATLGNLAALYEPIPLKKLDKLVHRGRQCTGSKLVPTTPRGIAELVRSARAGGITGILPDQVLSGENASSNAPFNGVECFTAALASDLIKKSGAAPVMGIVRQTETGSSAVHWPAELGVEKLIAGNERQHQWQYKRYLCRPKRVEDHFNWSAMPLLDEAGLKR